MSANPFPDSSSGPLIDEPQQIVVPPELRATLYEILDATMLVLRGHFGNIQLYDPSRNVLEMVAHRGFPEEFVRAVSVVPIGAGVAGAKSIQLRQRVIIPNVDEDDDYVPYRPLAAIAGFRAVQSTPIISRDGEILGALLTHLADARDFSQHELQVLDLYSRQAADAIVRSRVERDLATARSRLDAALRAGEMGVYDWNMVTGRVYGDANYQRMVDVPFDENGFAAREALSEAIHPDDRAERLRRVQRAIDTGEPYEGEYRFLSHGKTRWVISRGQVEYDRAGKPAHFTGVMVDITRRKQAEEELARLSRVHETILSTTDDFAYIFDRSGRFLYANRRLLTVWAKTLDEIIGKTTLELGYAKWHHEMHMREIAQVIQTKKPIRGEVPFTGASGIYGVYDYIFTPVLGPDGEVEVIVGTTRDVTERKRYEESLKEADQQKNAFLAQLAHELRNPLAPIRNAARIFRLKQSFPGDVMWASDVIDRQVKHLGRLIDDLLDVSRISRNKLELRRQRSELKDIVEAAVEISSPLIEQSGHRLIVDLAPEPTFLFADTARLTQAVMNLLNNAAKYTDSGGRIELTARREGDGAVIHVKDNGIGIEGPALSQVFDMFYQVDSSLERAQGGLGIGLSLVKSVMELHGGSVEARSAGIGKGSEFILRMPILASGETEPAPGARPDSDESGAAIISKRVLVADDNRDAAESLAVFLQIAGHIVTTAFDGEQALNAAESFRPDIAFIDLGMPKLNGYEVCRRIRATDWGKDMTLIAQTGWGQDEDKRRTREAKFNGHLVKPVDPMLVMKLVETSHDSKSKSRVKSAEEKDQD